MGIDMREDFWLALQSLAPQAFQKEYFVRETFRYESPSAQINLEPYYQAYLRVPVNRRSEKLAEIASEISGPSDVSSFENVCGDLLLGIDSLFGLTNQSLALEASGIDGGEAHSYFIREDLKAYVVLDLPLSRQLIRTEDIHKWGVSPELVFSEALNNLANRTSSPKFVRVAKGVYASPWEDGYDASRLLLGAAGVRPIAPSCVVLVVNANCVLMSEPDDGSIQRMLNVALEKVMEEEASFLYATPLTLKDGVWVPYQFREKPSLVSDLERVWRYQRYQDQQASLNKLFEGNDLAPFVATCMLFKGNGGYVSRCAWTEGLGVPQWLPRTDHIVIVRDDGNCDAYRWEDVERAIGAFPLEEGVGIPRYVVGDIPAISVLDAIPPYRPR